MQEFKPDLYVVARVIKNLIEKGPMNKTRLAGASEISYDKFLLYFDWMCLKNLIKEENGTVSVMEEGIRTYNLLVDWILKHVGKLMFRR